MDAHAMSGGHPAGCACRQPHVQRHLASRREFLERAGAGFGLTGLVGLLAQEGLLAAPDASSPLAPRAPHFSPKARAVIWLFMYGGPSGIDLFDYKPELERFDGKPFDGKIETFNGNPGPLMKSPYRFRRHGRSGAWVSEKFPALAEVVDDLTFLKAVRCKSNNHAPALFELNSGMTRVGFPSVGAWVTYGLGTENRNLPGYLVMYDPRGGPIGGPQNWSSGFLPSAYQGTPVRPAGTPILNLARRAGLDAATQRSQLDFLAEMNAAHRARHPAEADLLARIESYELAFRMQMEAPEAVDLAHESEETRRLYGLDHETTRYFGAQLLMARRLVERGVRFIQVYSGGGHQQQSWDAHFGLKENHDLHCAETDVPMRGLITDLKRRGLLDQTLLIWGGEFGRMPVSERGVGRDHNPHGFVMWMAGGGVRPGLSFGATDPIGHQAAEDIVEVNDLHATILHLLGLDHTRLTYEHNGRRFRLTDVAGRVLDPILA